MTNWVFNAERNIHTLQVSEGEAYLTIESEGDVWHVYWNHAGEAAPVLFGRPSVDVAKIDAAIMLRAISTATTLAAFKNSDGEAR